MKPATLLTFVVVILIALLHVLRFILRVEVTVGGAVVPLWASLPAVLLFASLAKAELKLTLNAMMALLRLM